MQDTRSRVIALMGAMLGAIGVDPNTLRAARVMGMLPGPKRDSGRPMSMNNHWMDGHGTLHRKDRKRDKSVSARQWKRMKKAARRAVAVQISKREQDECTQAQ